MDAILEELLNDSATAIASSHHLCEACHRHDRYSVELVSLSREVIALTRERLVRVAQRLGQ